MAVSQYEVLVHVVSEALGRYWPAPADGWRSVASEDRRVDLRPLRVLHPASRRIPEWIAPIQDAGETTLGETLRRVRMTPPDAVAAELAAMYPGGLPPELRSFVTTPTAALERFARAVEDLWDKHVRFRWPTIKSIVDREVLVTSAALMTKPEALNRVHPRFSFGADEVVLRGCGRVVRASVGARTVLLVPTVAADDALIVHLDEPDVLQLGYAARGGPSSGAMSRLATSASSAPCWATRERTCSLPCDGPRRRARSRLGCTALPPTSPFTCRPWRGWAWLTRRAAGGASITEPRRVAQR